MLCGVDADAGHSDGAQMVEILGHFLSNVGQFAVEVSQTDQIAVSHVVRVPVVVHVTFLTVFMNRMERSVNALTAYNHEIYLMSLNVRSYFFKVMEILSLIFKPLDTDLK